MLVEKLINLAENGDIDAMKAVAKKYYEHDMLEDAWQWYSKAARHDPEASYHAIFLGHFLAYKTISEKGVDGIDGLYDTYYKDIIVYGKQLIEGDYASEDTIVHCRTIIQKYYTVP